MMYGIANYAGKQELLLPRDDLQQIVKMNNISMKHDLKFAWNSGNCVTNRNLDSYFKGSQLQMQVAKINCSIEKRFVLPLLWQTSKTLRGIL